MNSDLFDEAKRLVVTALQRGSQNSGAISTFSEQAELEKSITDLRISNGQLQSSLVRLENEQTFCRSERDRMQTRLADGVADLQNLEQQLKALRKERDHLESEQCTKATYYQNELNARLVAQQKAAMDFQSIIDKQTLEITQMTRERQIAVDQQLKELLGKELETVRAKEKADADAKNCNLISSNINLSANNARLIDENKIYKLHIKNLQARCQQLEPKKVTATSIGQDYEKQVRDMLTSTIGSLVTVEDVSGIPHSGDILLMTDDSIRIMIDTKYRSRPLTKSGAPCLIHLVEKEIDKFHNDVVSSKPHVGIIYSNVGIKRGMTSVELSMRDGCHLAYIGHNQINELVRTILKLILQIRLEKLQEKTIQDIKGSQELCEGFSTLVSDNKFLRDLMVSVCHEIEPFRKQWNARHRDSTEVLRKGHNQNPVVLPEKLVAQWETLKDPTVKRIAETKKKRKAKISSDSEDETPRPSKKKKSSS